MAFPLLLFGLFTGLIAQYVDSFSAPVKNIRVSIQAKYKKMILAISAFSILVVFHFTYFQWITAYEKFDKLNYLENFIQLEILDTPVYDQKSQFFLYSLGGKYFNKGNYKTSKLFDKKFLEVWPNHLDVLYRAAYAEHMIGNNPAALQMAKNLKKLNLMAFTIHILLKCLFILMKIKSSNLKRCFNN